VAFIDSIQRSSGEQKADIWGALFGSGVWETLFGSGVVRGRVSFSVKTACSNDADPLS
jgi:hypothetical protein